MVDDCVGRIFLSKYNFSFITYEEIEGRAEEGIFIPFRYNAIRKYESSHSDETMVMAEFFARKLYKKKNKDTHILIQRMDKYQQTELRKYGLESIKLGAMFAFKDDVIKKKIDISSINSIINKTEKKDKSFEIKLLSRMVDEYDFSDYKYEKWKVIEIRRSLRNLLIKMEEYINNDTI